MKTKQPTPDMEAFRNDMLAVLNKHGGALDASEMVALAAYTIGQMIAMQDAQRWSTDAMLQIVIKNIEAGNAHAIANAADWMGRA